jgi:hypothetical protein
MNKNSIYKLDLARGELYWLAGSFGVTNLPIPDDAWRGLSAQDYEVDVQKGNASLLTRGLIRPSPGFGWQVDRLPSAIIQWLSSANSLLRKEYIPKIGETRIAHFFTSGEQGLSVEIDTDVAHFTLYETRAVLIEAIFNLLALPTTAKNTETAYQLPQPEAFLPAAWKNPELSEKMLRAAGTFDKVEDVTTWVKSLEYVIVVSKVQVDGRGNKTTGQFSICGDKKLVWGGEVENEKVSFALVPSKELTAIIDRMLGVAGRQK